MAVHVIAKKLSSSLQHTHTYSDMLSHALYIYHKPVTCCKLHTILGPLYTIDQSDSRFSQKMLVYNSHVFYV